MNFLLNTRIRDCFLFIRRGDLRGDHELKMFNFYSSWLVFCYCTLASDRRIYSPKEDLMTRKEKERTKFMTASSMLYLLCIFKCLIFVIHSVIIACFNALNCSSAKRNRSGNPTVFWLLRRAKNVAKHVLRSAQITSPRIVKFWCLYWVPLRLFRSR